MRAKLSPPHTALSPSPAYCSSNRGGAVVFAYFLGHFAGEISYAVPANNQHADSPDDGVSSEQPQKSYQRDYTLVCGPSARHQGLSTKLLEALERRLFCAGCPKTFLWSTETARVFYAFRGYVKIEDGHPTKMEKS
ncbi:GNAT family N-acetyltransferase [Rhizobium sp. 3T7]|uniref:GNAT family N-acetyltransferase n=1 Tax=Rhizobium sp. 3T7 TaxID=2874922 RepID=UPI001CCB0656|nr:GNAT family N-acetyltransferase [Rhizobium sp. 3T7]